MTAENRFADWERNPEATGLDQGQPPENRNLVWLACFLGQR